MIVQVFDLEYVCRNYYVYDQYLVVTQKSSTYQIIYFINIVHSDHPVNILVLTADITI